MFPMRNTEEGDDNYCRVLVKDTVSFHYEVLESIMRQFPLPDSVVHSPICNSSTLIFDFRVCTKEKRGSAWASYMKSRFQDSQAAVERRDTTVTLDLNSSTINEWRKLGQIQDVSKPLRDPLAHVATIWATCECSNEEVFIFLNSSNTNFCVLHNTCLPLRNHPRVQYLSPPHNTSAYFLPIHLPPVPIVHTDNSDGPVRICSIGHTTRRSFEELALALASLLQPPPTTTRNVHVWILGKGPLPETFHDWMVSDLVRQFQIDGMKEYHEKAAECDVILTLVEPASHPDYFGGSNKLTGSIPIAIAYKKEMIIHEELERIYHDHLTAPVETYGDNNGSFEDALKRFLQRKGYPVQQ